MKQRNSIIDYIKAIGVIGVMVMHLHTPINYLTPIITNCYIPIFFLCSGYTTSPEKTVSVKKKFHSLMFPYFAYYVFFFIMILLGVVKPVQYELLGFVYSRSHVGNTTLQSLDIGPSWFLTAMFATFVLYKVINAIKVSRWLKASLTGLMGMLIAYFCPIRLPWSIENVMVLSSYIFIGQLFRICMDGRMHTRIVWMVAPVILYCVCAIYNGYVSLSMSDYGRNILLCYVLPILAFYTLFKILPPPDSNLNKLRIWRFLSYLGQNSLTVFMSHMLFYGIFKFVLDNSVLNGMPIINKYHFLLQALVVLLTVLTTVLSCKWQSVQLERLKTLILNYGDTDKQ